MSHGRFLETKTYRTKTYRALNWLGRKQGASSLSVEWFRAKAAKQTKLDCYSEDEGFWTSLSLVIDTLKENPRRLNYVGGLQFKDAVLQRLCNQLLMNDLLRRNPDLSDREVEQPIVITGHPRTGTTLLHNLLAQDTTSRVLRWWELHRPMPPITAETGASDPRVKIARKQLKQYKSLILSKKARMWLEAAHMIDWDYPEECQYLLWNTTKTEYWIQWLQVPEYYDWVKRQDFSDVYRFFRQQLQVMTSSYSGARTVLKSPYHLPRLDELLTALPNAVIVWTHRTPFEVVPSLCSLFAVVRQSLTDHLDLHATGQTVLDYLAWGAERASSLRDSPAGPKIIDVGFKELVADPIATVKRIYRAVGHELTDEAEGVMRGWLESHHSGRKSKHIYDLGTYGLKTTEIDDAFAGYLDTHRDLIV